MMKDITNYSLQILNIQQNELSASSTIQVTALKIRMLPPSHPPEKNKTKYLPPFESPLKNLTK